MKRLTAPLTAIVPPLLLTACSGSNKKDTVGARHIADEETGATYTRVK